MSRDHLDPTGKRALFETPVSAPDHLGDLSGPEGKAALFSTGPSRAGTVLVECSGCDTASRVTLGELAGLMVQGSVWLPGRRHSRHMRCPSCRRRNWCQIRWRG